MADFTAYITKNGDRWDSIAWAAYGDITKQKDIMDANPDIALLPSFGDGITLFLPIIPEVKINSGDLPLWKQGDDTTVIEPDILTVESALATPPKTSGGGLGFDDDESFDYFLDLTINT